MHEKALHMSLLPSDTGKWKPLPWTLNLTSLLWSDFLSFSKAPPMPGWVLVPVAIPVGTLTPDQTLWPSVPVSLLWGTLTLCCVVGLTKHSAKLWTHAYGILLELSAGSYFQKGNLIRSVPQAIKVFCANPWTIATTLPGFSIHGVFQARYWSQLLCPPPGNLPDPGIEPRSLMSPALAGGFFTANAIWKALTWDWAARKVLACLFEVIKIVYSQRSHKNIFPKPCGY